MRRLVILAALALAACAEVSVPMATPQASLQGQSFLAPPAADGALYVYVPDRQPVLWGVTIGARPVGDLMTNTWLRVDLPAGEKDVRCTGGVGTPSLLVNLAVGEIRYIELRKHWIEIQCLMSEVPAATAQPIIRAGKRVREVR